MKDFNMPTVNLSMHTLIHECSKRERPANDIYMDIAFWNRENIHQVFKYRKFDYDFTDYVTCFNDGDHIIGFIRPSYDDFLIKVCMFLGIRETKDIVDDETLTERLMERIERLKQIKTEKELGKEFPIIYDDLVQGRRFINSVESMPRKTEEEQARYEDMRHYYYACALKQRLDRFIKDQVELYTRFVTKRKEYKELISNKSLNQYFRKNFDMDKVALYVVHSYLYQCEHAEDEETYEKYMSFIEKYLESDYKKDVAIRTKNGYIINYQTIESRVLALRRKHAKKEVLAGWELVPEGKEVKPMKLESTPRVLTMREVDVDALRQAGRRKQNFYGESHYLAKVIGLEQYRGYVGYIYPNGQVLLDREYNEDTPRSAKGNAIYHMKVADFETLSRLDKTVLRKHPRVGRIYHSTHWEEKAQEIIDQPANLLEQQDAIQLVKRLRSK